MTVQCVTCGGTYTPVQPDGTQYFHRCPPLSVAELKAALDAKALQLAPADATRLQLAKDAETRTPPKAGELAPTDAVLATLTIDRPNVRDENVLAKHDDKDRPVLKAIGQGTRPVP
jgi:hypothetical protein